MLIVALLTAVLFVAQGTVQGTVQGMALVRPSTALAAEVSSDSSSTQGDAAPSIVVSIKPLHSLVAAVTRGVTDPVLLFEGFSSPHTAQLKPSMMRTLHNSDLLVWVGAGIEVFLERVVADLDPQSAVIAFAQIDGIQRWPFRFDQHGHGHSASTEFVRQSTDDASDTVVVKDNDNDDVNHGHQADASGLDEVDYHFWFDPQNAARLVTYLSEYLAEIDPVNATAYKSNAQNMVMKLSQLDQQLKTLLFDVSDVPYLVFHDSYQYMERRYGLHRALVIAEQPEVQPGAKRLKQILQQVESQNVKCLFTEPQFPAKVVSMLQRDSSVDVATLDPLASSFAAGPDLYAQWMLQLGQTVHECLTR